jgi:hypothetical protein
MAPSSWYRNRAKMSTAKAKAKQSRRKNILQSFFYGMQPVILTSFVSVYTTKDAV